VIQWKPGNSSLLPFISNTFALPSRHERLRSTNEITLRPRFAPATRQILPYCLRLQQRAKADAAKRPWPKSLSAQAAAVQTALAELAAPADEVQIAKRFTAANKDRIAELLETLSSLGKARQLDDGRYVPV